MNREQLLSKIRQAGVVGAGGGGFPAYKKLDANVRHIIANGAECEPLLYKDRETMIQSKKELFEGLDIMRQITGAETVTIAVKQKNKDVISGFGELLNQYKFETFVYKDVYPAGDEYVLVYEITGRRIPPGGIPLQVECVVSNTETIVNIARAVKDIPVTEKWLTICGAVKEPVTTIVPVGVSFKDCIELSGGATTDRPVVLTGGVMMGGVEFDLSAAVSKTIGGLIVLPDDHYLVKRKTTPRELYTRVAHGQCDQCTLCTELCPRYIMGYPIEPHRVMRNLLMTGDAKERGSLWAQFCCECNICTFIACPEQLDPKSICVDAKALLKEKNLSRSAEELKDLFRPVHPVRKAREAPISTLYRRLGLIPYDRQAKFKRVAFTPELVVIPTDSHAGLPAKPIVKVDDLVKKGQLIASVSEGELGCPVHAGIDGRVSRIDEKGIHIKADKI